MEELQALKQENERLKKLIEDGYEYGRLYAMNDSNGKSYEQFLAENNL